jgi:hypothetical protein
MLAETWEFSWDETVFLDEETQHFRVEEKASMAGFLRSRDPATRNGPKHSPVHDQLSLGERYR